MVRWWASIEPIPVWAEGHGGSQPGCTQLTSEDLSTAGQSFAAEEYDRCVELFEEWCEQEGFVSMYRAYKSAVAQVELAAYIESANSILAAEVESPTGMSAAMPR